MNANTNPNKKPYCAPLIEVVELSFVSCLCDNGIFTVSEGSETGIPEASAKRNIWGDNAGFTFGSDSPWE